MLPSSYLLTAPDDLINPLGMGMYSSDLIKGLQRCNRKVVVPMPEHYEAMGWRYPNMSTGWTCIWIGPPPFENMAGRPKYKNAKKVCSIRLGYVPEFTQLDEDGELIARGWRDIQRRFIMAGGAEKHRVEQVFEVHLDYEGDDGKCLLCARANLSSKANGRTQLCDEHEEARMSPEQKKKLMDYMLKCATTKGQSQVGYTSEWSAHVGND